ncbi:hypothetical protein FACS1894201_05780 [Bacteroidia bacterium]|nr:hypothetical protein FACS1894201_05780 [Bacteroidia bacterium]
MKPQTKIGKRDNGTARTRQDRTMRSNTTPSVQNVKRSEKKWLRFSLKGVALLGAVVATVLFTDSKEWFVGDMSNNHAGRKWQSFYRLTRNHNFDIVVFGNSRASAGIEPYILSSALGVNTFVFGTPGGTMSEAYCSLTEALRLTRPKLVIMDTHPFYIGGMEGSSIQSFESKQCSLWRKLVIMFLMFPNRDVWLKAWSPTILNHSFLFSDHDRIKWNMEHPIKNPIRHKLELGRFSHGSEHLSDEDVANFEPYLDGSTIEVEAGKRRFLRRMAEACAEKNIPILFTSLPLYYKAFSHYDSLKALMISCIQENCSMARWNYMDLQDPYDSILFTPKAFDKDKWHMTYEGMVVSTYKLANFLVEQGYDFPDRSNEAQWKADFYDQPYFAFNQPVDSSLNGYTMLGRNMMINNLPLQEVSLFRSDNNTQQLIVKVQRDTDDPNAPDDITIPLRITENGSTFIVPITVSKIKECFPPHYDVYAMYLRGDLKVELY